MDLNDKINLLKQLRWREAHLADARADHEGLKKLVFIHQALEALEATVELGKPMRYLDTDLDGWPTDPDDQAYQG